MPRLTNSVPKLRLHRRSGRARVQLGCREFWLGPYGSDEAQQNYNRLLGLWLASGRPTHWEPESEDEGQQPQPRIISVTEIVVRYVEHLHERWPAPSGKTKEPIRLETPAFFSRQSRVIGSVAEDDAVEKAVSSAGAMAPNIR